jgi:hypothetical protein
MNATVTSKFGKGENLFIVEFVFFHFICSALINPVKFQLVEGKPILSSERENKET